MKATPQRHTHTHHRTRHSARLPEAARLLLTAPLHTSGCEQVGFLKLRGCPLHEG